MTFPLPIVQGGTTVFSGGATVITLSSNTTDYNLANDLTNNYSWDGSTAINVTLNIGSGVNIVNGDYSRGANGFWIENGEIVYPVNEVTVAGNLNQIFNQIQKVGNDPEHNGSIFSGSVLVDDLMIAGS